MKNLLLVLVLVSTSLFGMNSHAWFGAKGKKLHEAIEKGEVKEAKKMLQQGVNINLVIRDLTPLHRALTIENPSEEMIQLLLMSKSIEIPKDTLFLAIHPSVPEVAVEMLLEKGANFEITQKVKTRRSKNYNYTMYEYLTPRRLAKYWLKHNTDLTSDQKDSLQKKIDFLTAAEDKKYGALKEESHKERSGKKSKTGSCGSVFAEAS